MIPWVIMVGGKKGASKSNRGKGKRILQKTVVDPDIETQDIVTQDIGTQDIETQDSETQDIAADTDSVKPAKRARARKQPKPKPVATKPVVPPPPPPVVDSTESETESEILNDPDESVPASQQSGVSSKRRNPSFPFTVKQKLDIFDWLKRNPMCWDTSNAKYKNGKTKDYLWAELACIFLSTL